MSVACCELPGFGTEPTGYSLPRGVHVNVHEGERVRAGEQLMNGPSNRTTWRGPRRAYRARWGAVLRVLGEKELQKYLVNEIQEVYRLAPQRAHSARWGPRRKGRQHQRQDSRWTSSGSAREETLWRTSG